MRDASVAALCASLWFCPVALADAVTNAKDAVTMAATPSGAGDPNTIVCRAPRPIRGTGLLGPKRCGYNWEWAKLMVHGKDLAPDGTTVIDIPMVAVPTGKGNPDAVTCREPQPLPGPGIRLRELGPEFCQTNRFWARLIRNHQIVDARGVVISDPSMGNAGLASPPMPGPRT
jgi:hypothetical protein